MIYWCPVLILTQAGTEIDTVAPPHAHQNSLSEKPLDPGVPASPLATSGAAPTWKPQMMRVVTSDQYIGGEEPQTVPYFCFKMPALVVLLLFVTRQRRADVVSEAICQTLEGNGGKIGLLIM